MKKLYRVKISSEFKKILDKKLVLGKNSSFTIYFSSNDLDHGRIGITVSKKNGNAVIRSKIRRQVRAMINQTKVLDNHLDLIIIVKQEYNNNSYQENLNNLKSIFDQIKERK